MFLEMCRCVHIYRQCPDVSTQWLDMSSTYLDMSTNIKKYLHDANGVVNGTIAFKRSQWPKWGETWHLQSFDSINTGIAWDSMWW